MDFSRKFRSYSGAEIRNRSTVEAGDVAIVVFVFGGGEDVQELQMAFLVEQYHGGLEGTGGDAKFLELPARPDQRVEYIPGLLLRKEIPIGPPTLNLLLQLDLIILKEHLP